MDCNKAMELLSEYIDGMLSDKIKIEVENHINSCNRCKQEYDMLNKIIDSCHQLDEIDLPDDFHQKLHNRLVEETMDIKRENSFRNRKKSYTAIAAALVLVVSLGAAINSGMLNFGSQKKAESAKSSEAVQNDSVQMEAAAAPKLAAKSSDQNSEMKTDSKPEEEARINSFDASDNSRERIVYNTVTVNLSESDYKKYYENIAVIIEGFGGYLKQKEPLIYMMPQKNLDVFINKLKSGYSITTISLTSEDITEEYTRIEGEVAELESEQKQTAVTDNTSTENGENNTKSMIDKKREEFKELRNKAEYAYIQISVNK